MSLSTEAVKGSVAFRGNSADELASVIEEVKLRMEGRRKLYPPKSFPNFRFYDAVSALRSEPGSEFVAEIDSDEAAAMKYLMDECAVLAQRTPASFRNVFAVICALGKENGFWVSDMVDGMSMFGIEIAKASLVRERIRTGLTRPDGNTIGDKVRQLTWDRVHEGVEMDGLKLGKETGRMIVEWLNEDVEEQIRLNPEGAKTEAEITERVESKKYGFEYALNLYLEVLQLADRFLDSVNNDGGESGPLSLC